MTATMKAHGLTADDVRASLEENHRSIQEWSDSRRSEAAATVTSPSLSTYYESLYCAGTRNEE